jgi:hypothetical protein
MTLPLWDFRRGLFCGRYAHVLILETGGLLFFGYLTSAAYPHAALPLLRFGLGVVVEARSASRVDLEDAGSIRMGRGLIVVVGHPDVNDSALSPCSSVPVPAKPGPEEYRHSGSPIDRLLTNYARMPFYCECDLGVRGGR